MLVKGVSMGWYIKGVSALTTYFDEEVDVHVSLHVRALDPVPHGGHRGHRGRERARGPEGAFVCARLQRGAPRRTLSRARDRDRVLVAAGVRHQTGFRAVAVAVVEVIIG